MTDSQLQALLACLETDEPIDGQMITAAIEELARAGIEAVEALRARQSLRELGGTC